MVSMPLIMHMKRILVIGCVFLTIMGCTHEVPHEKSCTIDISNTLKENGSKINVSRIVNKFEYVKLETDSNCYLDRIKFPNRDIKFTDSLIIISDGSGLYSFGMDGKFKNQYGRKGKGPGEYKDVWSFVVLPENNEVIVFSNQIQTLFYYSLSGEFIKSQKLENNPTIICKVFEKPFFHFGKGYREHSKYYAYRSFKIEETPEEDFLYFSYEDKLEKNGADIGTGVVLFNQYCLNDTFRHWEYVYDTIWVYSKDLELVEKYYISVGSERLPLKYIIKPYIHNHKDFENYIKLTHVVESNTDFFFKIINKVNLNLVWYDKRNNASTKIQYFSKGNSIEFGFFNDIDGGITYWPVNNVDDSTTFMICNAYQFLNSINENSSAEIQELIAESTIYDNPIIILARHKINEN